MKPVSSSLLVSRRRAQVIAFDVLVAAVILSTLFFIQIEQDSRNSTRLAEAARRDSVFSAAENAASVLVRTPGDPVDWHLFPPIDSATIDALGLTDGTPNKLDPDKVDAFMQSFAFPYPYQNASVLLGTRSIGADFSVLVAYANGTVLYSGGPTPPDNATIAVSHRVVFVNNTIARFDVTAWLPDGVGRPS